MLCVDVEEDLWTPDLAAGADAVASDVTTFSPRLVVSLPGVSAPDPSPRSFDIAEVDATLASSLDSLDDAINYRNWIVDLCAPHLAGPVLEVGAGHGTFTECYAAFGDVTAVEPGPYAAKLLIDRYADDARISTVAGLVDDLPSEATFGSAVMINVLEHIEDAHGVLCDILDRLEPGGRLCIWVPSYEFLYSEFDAKLGHVRRYRKRQLEADVQRAGFELVEARHVNLPGWFSWLILCRFLRQEPTSPVTVKIFDKWIVPVVRWVESRVRVPFGVSVFLVARKPV